jgi:putative FmdB family regulatory protein
MPLYEYKCTKCHATTEVLQRVKDAPLRKCPKCGGRLVKLISSPAIQFKGNGWYITDYAKKSSPAERQKPKPKSESGKGPESPKSPGTPSD